LVIGLKETFEFPNSPSIPVTTLLDWDAISRLAALKTSVIFRPAINCQTLTNCFSCAAANADVNQPQCGWCFDKCVDHQMPGTCGVCPCVLFRFGFFSVPFTSFYALFSQDSMIHAPASCTTYLPSYPPPSTTQTPSSPAVPPLEKEPESQTAPESSGSSLSAGGKAGIAILVIALISSTIFGIWYLVKKRK
jgi:hypothetical protein